MSASPSYIRELIARNKHANSYLNVYDDAFSFEGKQEGFEDNYEAELLSSLQDVDSQDLAKALDDEEQESEYYVEEKENGREDINYVSRITRSGIPIPGRKPAYGADSAVQRIEDFSDNPSSVQLAFIEPEAGGHTSDAYPPNSMMLEAVSDAVRQPIMKPDEQDQEKALVSFTLNPDQVSLDPNLKDFLLDHAVNTFKSDPKVRLEIHAYASTENGQEYSDVRRSLARALEVRSFLLEQNIDPSRLKITPMGQDNDDTTDDRIDLLFIAPR